MNRVLPILMLAMISGAAALAHELLWTRRLIDLLGATDWVTGRVLGVFFLGLSLGGWLTSRWSYVGTSPLKMLAFAELAISLLVLPVIFLPAWTEWIWPAIGTRSLVLWPGSLIKFALTVVVVLPPSVAMGTTLPFFINAATASGGSLATRGVLIYSINTLGGVLGLWLTTTIVLDRFGVQGAMLVVAGMNLSVALMAWAIDVAGSPSATSPATLASVEGRAQRRRKMRLQSPSRSVQSAAKSVSRNGLLFLSFCSGAVILAFEVLAIRLAGLVVPSSFLSTSTLLASVILFLGLASLTVALLNRVVSNHAALLACALAGAAVLCAFCPLILYHSTDQLVSIRYLASLHGQTISSTGAFWFRVLGLVAISTGGTLFLAGLVFPTVMKISALSDLRGKSVGLLLALNGLGGLFGSEVCNWIIVPTVGIYSGFFVVGMMLAGLAAWVSHAFQYRIGYLLFAGSAFLLSVGFIFSSRLPYLSPRATKPYRVQATQFGQEGVLLVVEDAKKSRGIIINNQYLLGSSNAAVAERRQLILPWLLHPNAKQVCSLGFATGISAGALEKLDRPPAVTAIEISSIVASAARDHFKDSNQGFLERAANRLMIEDARTYMAASQNQFDLIVGDLFRPHGAGEGRLFSKEHFSNVRRALKPDGLYCQWLPAHQLNQHCFEIIATTFQSKFPQTLVISVGSQVDTPTLGLVGWREGYQLDPIQLQKRFKQVPSTSGINDSALANAQLLIHGVLKDNAFSSAPINTLDNAIIEIAAGRFWILKDLRKDRPPDNLETGFLEGRNRVEFQRRLQEKMVPVFDIGTGQQFLKLLEAELTEQQ